MSSITLAAVEAFAYRAPIKVGLGAFRDRPTVLGRLCDTDGAIAGNVLQAIQPDGTKWGGITGSCLLEFDCHPKVGREAVLGTLLPVTEGRVPVPQGAGLGAGPDLAALQPFQTWPQA